MATVMILMNVPEGMAPYLNRIDDSESIFARNAMLLYPFIQNMTISHGRAAEILDVQKTDLIESYDSMGIPCLNQSKQDLMNDILTLDKVLKAAK